MTIQFGVWSPSEAVFWQSWVDAGICSAPKVYASTYAGQLDTTTSWHGIVVKTPAVVDPATMQIITPAVIVPGWHTNVRVYGPALIAQFTAGLPQTDADGNLLPIWQRTRAATVFSLSPQAADASTGFPAGYRNATGVTYADHNAFTSPRNVWA